MTPTQRGLATRSSEPPVTPLLHVQHRPYGRPDRVPTVTRRLVVPTPAPLRIHPEENGDEESADGAQGHGQSVSQGVAGGARSPGRSRHPGLSVSRRHPTDRSFRRRACGPGPGAGPGGLAVATSARRAASTWVPGAAGSSAPAERSGDRHLRRRPSRRRAPRSTSGPACPGAATCPHGRGPFQFSAVAFLTELAGD